MLVKVYLRRQGGVHRPMHGPDRAVRRGELQLTRTAGPRSVPMLQLAEVSDWPVLFEPRLVSMWGKELTFVGYERCGKAWVLQQWHCELL